MTADDFACRLCAVLIERGLLTADSPVHAAILEVAREVYTEARAAEAEAAKYNRYLDTSP